MMFFGYPYTQTGCLCTWKNAQVTEIEVKEASEILRGLLHITIPE